MATATPKRRRPATRKTATVFDKYGSAIKLFSNYGFAGLAFGYLLIYTIPQGQQSFQAALEKQADQSREDRKDAIGHGERAVERIAGSIDGLKDSWTKIQGVTQGNQKTLIEETKKTNEILESKMGKGQNE